MERDWSVLIPSDDMAHLEPCLEALLGTHGQLDPKHIIVSTGELSRDLRDAELTVVSDPVPFNFSRRVNLGVKAAGTRDVFLMGDDVKILSTDTIVRLSSESDFRILAPSVRGRHGPWWQAERQNHAMVPFVSFIAVYLPREILEIVGPMWEGFPGYGYDDMDYCVRAKQKGFSCGVEDVPVEHSLSIQSSFLTRFPEQIGDMERMARRAFMSKYSWYENKEAIFP